MVKKIKERKYSIFLIVLGVLSIVCGLLVFVNIMWGYLGFVLLITLAIIWVFKLVQSQKVDVPALVIGLISLIIFMISYYATDLGSPTEASEQRKVNELAAQCRKVCTDDEVCAIAARNPDKTIAQEQLQTFITLCQL